MNFKLQVSSRYDSVGPEKLQSIAKEQLSKFFPDFKGPFPNIKVVNHTASSWLGKCRFDRKNDTTSTIFIQKSVLGDEVSLRRILLHELVHHVDFLTNTLHLSRPELKRYDGHGKFFEKEAARINGIMGKDYVSKESDSNIVVNENNNEFYVLIMPSFSFKDRLGFSYAVRPSAKQKEYIKTMLAANKGAKLVKTKDKQWTAGSTIGARSISIPREPDMVEALKRLYDEGKPAAV